MLTPKVALGSSKEDSVSIRDQRVSLRGKGNSSSVAKDNNPKDTK
jgi:hypothetical protein